MNTKVISIVALMASLLALAGNLRIYRNMNDDISHLNIADDGILGIPRKTLRIDRIIAGSINIVGHPYENTDWLPLQGVLIDPTRITIQDSSTIQKMSLGLGNSRMIFVIGDTSNGLISLGGTTSGGGFINVYGIDGQIGTRIDSGDDGLNRITLLDKDGERAVGLSSGWEKVTGGAIATFNSRGQIVTYMGTSDENDGALGVFDRFGGEGWSRVGKK